MKEYDLTPEQREHIYHDAYVQVARERMQNGGHPEVFRYLSGLDDAQLHQVIIRNSSISQLADIDNDVADMYDLMIEKVRGHVRD
jgi:hypothetical protein